MNQKILYEHVFVHNYFRCKEQISKLQSFKADGYRKFCSLCFEPECKHDLPMDNYNNAFEQLSMWQDVNLIYGKDRFVCNERNIPKLPAIGFDIAKDYVIKPKLDLPLSIISVKVNNGEKVAFTNNIFDTKLTSYANDNVFGEGVWYGYFDGKFHLLTFFRGNNFSNIRKYDLPYEKVTGLNSLEDYKNSWYLPQVSHYHEFHRYLHEN